MGDKPITRGYLSALAGLTLLLTSSCISPLLLAGGVGAAGGYTYVKGEVKQIVNKRLGRCFVASKQALENLELPITKNVTEADKAIIKSNFSDGKGITIKISRIDGETSEIRIRVGVIGDEKRAARIMKAINQYL